MNSSLLPEISQANFQDQKSPSLQAHQETNEQVINMDSSLLPETSQANSQCQQSPSPQTHQKTNEQSINVNSSLLPETSQANFQCQQSPSPQIHQETNEQAINMVSSLLPETSEANSQGQQSPSPQTHAQPQLKSQKYTEVEDELISNNFKAVGGQYECNSCSQRYVKSQCIPHLQMHEDLTAYDPDGTKFSKTERSSYLICNACEKLFLVQKALKHHRVKHNSKRKSQKIKTEDEELSEPSRVMRGNQYLPRKKHAQEDQTLVGQQNAEADVYDLLLKNVEAARNRSEMLNLLLKESREAQFELKKGKEKAEKQNYDYEKKLQKVKLDYEDVFNKLLEMKKSFDDETQANIILKQQLADMQKKWEEVSDANKQLQDRLDWIRTCCIGVKNTNGSSN